MTTLRLDNIKPGSIVLLDFGSGKDESRAFFRGIIGSGSDRKAAFTSLDYAGGLYNWDAYRYNGGWVYGSSAERLRVVDVIDGASGVSPLSLR